MHSLRSAIVVSVVVLLAPSLAAAQSYPTKSVRVITAWPAGGLTDVAGRIVFQKISENVGQQFIVDNRAGANGIIGADLVAKSPPDGYTLMVHSTSHISNAHMYKKLPYDTLKDFTPIGLLVAQTGLIVVHPSMPVKSIKDLVALAKARPDQILYGSAGNGSFSHLAMALFDSMAGTRTVHVPYKGGGPATTGFLAGETQVLVSSPAAVANQVKANRMRLIAVTSDQRVPQFSATPTVAEAGVPGYEFRAWVGVFGPAGVPKPIVDRVNSEIKKVLESRNNKLDEFEPWYMTPEQTAARMVSDYEKYGKLIKMTGARAE